jgi:hypothetical protein
MSSQIEQLNNQVEKQQLEKQQLEKQQLDKDIKDLVENTHLWINEYMKADDGRLDVNDVVALSVFLMHESQKIVKIKSAGNYKKKLVIEVVRKVLEMKLFYGTTLTKEMIDFYIDVVLSNLIDVLVMAAKGSLELCKLKSDCVKKCATGCLCQ